jgi:hypothetical protein
MKNVYTTNLEFSTKATIFYNFYLQPSSYERNMIFLRYVVKRRKNCVGYLSIKIIWIQVVDLHEIINFYIKFISYEFTQKVTILNCNDPVA